MCGIVGITGSDNVVPAILDGLRRLEYRGYDSAGIASSSNNGIAIEKCSGKLRALEKKLRTRKLAGTTGLGHTRWATHGPPTNTNAHPHFSCNRRIMVVHNGIVENFVQLRDALIREGHRLRSDTDTEVIVHLIEKYHRGDPVKAVCRALQKLEGSFALGVLFADHPGTLIAARQNCPLLLGLAKGKNLLASDLSALLPHTRKVIVLEEGELARLTPETVDVFDAKGRPRPSKPTKIDWTLETAEKGGYPHYMLKEIYEQPETVEAELTGRLHGDRVTFEDVSPSFIKNIKRISIAACGTAWHAGLVAKYALEEMAGIPVDVGFASEIRYADQPFDSSTLLLAISQSGETADTLAALRLAQQSGARTLGLTNVRGSTLSREADHVIHMRAGLEIGVAATKTYTSQLINVLLLGMAFGRARGHLPPRRVRALLRETRTLPRILRKTLSRSPDIQKIGKKFSRGYDFMYIGRRYNLATAFEGALKMKEISYLHAEGYGGGEMKHGPLALVDRRLTTVAVAVKGRVYEKMISNIQEIRARGGKIISVVQENDRRLRRFSDHLITIPNCDEVLSPIPAVIPMQLLAYHTAVACGRDVDQPRNLAKSVTVE